LAPVLIAQANQQTRDVRIPNAAEALSPKNGHEMHPEMRLRRLDVRL
jgi:hypothetical protein